MFAGKAEDEIKLNRIPCTVIILVCFQSQLYIDTGCVYCRHKQTHTDVLCRRIFLQAALHALSDTTSLALSSTSLPSVSPASCNHVCTPTIENSRRILPGRECGRGHVDLGRIFYPVKYFFGECRVNCTSAEWLHWDNSGSHYAFAWLKERKKSTHPCHSVVAKHSRQTVMRM